MRGSMIRWRYFDRIQVGDQAPQHVEEQCNLCFAETGHRLAVAGEQNSDRFWHPLASLLCQGEPSDAAILEIGLAFDQSIARHARQHLRHRRLACASEAREVALSIGDLLLERDQHGQLPDRKAIGLEPCFGEAGKATRCEPDQVPRG